MADEIEDPLPESGQSPTPLDKPTLGAIRANKSYAEEARRLRVQREADPAYQEMRFFEQHLKDNALDEDQVWAAAARAAGYERVNTPRPPADDEEESLYVDWKLFWETDHAAEDWVAWPLIPAGRQIALYAPAKTGKSLLALDLCASLAAGKPILGGAVAEPVDVLYLDYEMTEADLKERLTDLGYGPKDDLSRFHYALQPSIPPLDTILGGQVVSGMAQEVNAKVVIVDTYGRAVKGEENSADTTRDFYRCTGLTLKREGVSLLRTDHSGKDPTLGQRGSSAKTDDVDVVFSVTRIEGGLSIKRTHSRVRWVPENLTVDIETAGVLRHVVVGGRGYAAGTADMAQIMDEMGLELGISMRKAGAAVREAGHSAPNAVILDALRFRREKCSVEVTEHSKTGVTEHSTEQNTKVQVTDLRSTHGAVRSSSGDAAEHLPYVIREHAPSGANEALDELMVELFGEA